MKKESASGSRWGWRSSAVSLLDRVAGWALFAVASLLALGGCTLGPTEKTVYLVVTEGNPVVIMEQTRVKARLLTDEAARVEEVDITGWVAMPEKHFEVLRATATRK